VRILEREHGESALEQIREIVRSYPNGNSELQFAVVLDDGSRVYLKSHRVRLEVTRELQDRLDDLLGPGNIQLLTSRPKPAANGNGNGNGQRWGGSYAKTPGR
jgi:DNA polymerase-3 subunit alpha